VASVCVAGCQLLSGISDIELVAGSDAATHKADAVAHDAPSLHPSDAGTPPGTHDATAHDAGKAEASPADVRAVETGAAAETGVITEEISVLGGGDAYASAAMSLPLPYGGTVAGHFLAVMIAYQAPDAAVASVTDDAPNGGNAYVSANVRAVSSCAATEIWYARDVVAGLTTITVSFNTPAAGQAWIVEASGLAATGGGDVGQTGTGAAVGTIVAPTVTPSGLDALIVSVVASCGGIGGGVGGLASGSPFVALPVAQGDDAAYYVPHSSGSYGPVFNGSVLNGPGTEWNASVAGFR
jgi:hypothetical protein